MQSKKAKILPPFLYNVLRSDYILYKLFKAYIYDLKRYLNHSSVLKVQSENHLLSRIAAHSHMVEKGLAMPEMRPGFGLESNLKLVELIREGTAAGLSDKFEIVSAIASLKQYLDYHLEQKLGIDGRLKKEIETLVLTSQLKNNLLGGKKSITKKELLTKWSINFHSFIKSRHSIRTYSSEEINREIITKCIDSANYSPSVCNRQTSRVMVIEDKNEIIEALKYQNGNRGFGHRATKLLIVMSDIRAFNDYEERNQNYIDAGLFSMSLLLALQSEGIGACPLNWCAKEEVDSSFKRAFSIPPHYAIAMFISIGNLPDELNVAVSRRQSGKSLEI